MIKFWGGKDERGSSSTDKKKDMETLTLTWAENGNTTSEWHSSPECSRERAPIKTLVLNYVHT
jgi:hypothetical protein